MIDVIFTINGVDYSGLLSTYRVVCDIEYPHTMTAIDGTEYYGKMIRRPSIYFSLRPLTDAETAAVVYTDPDTDTDYTAYMRFTSSISSAFGLRSIDGNRYYKGSEMCLRQLSPR